MEFLAGWAVVSIFVGMIGSDRKYGFWGSFALSFFLSPLIGILIILFTKTEAEVLHKTELETKQLEVLDSISKNTATDVKPTLTDELNKLAELRNTGYLTDTEFEAAKAKLLK